MFSNIISEFDPQMLRNHLIKNHNDEFDDEQSLYYTSNGIKARIVWVTNYTNNEDFPIHVPADDPVLQNIDNTIEQESLPSNEKDDSSLLNKIHTLDLSKLNLDDLLLLLYRLQQKTTENSVTNSNSTISSSSEHKSSTLHSLSPTLSHAVQSSLSMLNETSNRRPSSFILSNIADVPKQLTTTLAKPISSFHSQNTKHIHSPNDVVDKLLQSFNLRNNEKVNQLHLSQQSLPGCTYQECQQHKAKLISNLLSSNSISKSSYNFYH